jgi:hypothetical protein
VTIAMRPFELAGTPHELDKSEFRSTRTFSLARLDAVICLDGAAAGEATCRASGPPGIKKKISQT